MNLGRVEHLKAIIFDLDGVLFHSEKAHESAFMQVLRSIGIQRFNYRLVAGMRTSEALQRILRKEKRKASARQIAAWARRKQDLANRLLSRRPPVVPGSRVVLSKLAQQYQLALVSGSRRKNVDLFLKASKTRSLFSLVMGGEDLTHSKPSPLLYKGVLRRLKRKAHEVLVVEDSLHGVQAAARAHLRVIGVKGSVPAQRLRSAGAWRVLNDIRELTRA